MRASCSNVYINASCHYTTASTRCVAALSRERMDAWERVGKVLDSFENGLLMTLMQDTFNVTKELKNDLESL